MPIKRPTLRNQPPKKVLRKTSDIHDVSLGGNFVIADISRAFHKLKTLIISKIEDLDEKEKELSNFIAEITSKVENELTSSREKIGKEMHEVDSHVVEVKELLQKEISEIKKSDSLKGDKGDKGDSLKGDKGLKGDPGVKGDKGDKGPKGDSTKGKDGKDAVLTLDMLKDLMSKLPKGDKMRIEDIVDLERRLKNISNKAGSAIAHGGGGQGSWKQSALVGDIDGVNTVYTFAGNPPAEFSERVFLNYTEQNPFTDYTINGNTVTYTVAPHSSLSTFPHIIRHM